MSLLLKYKKCKINFTQKNNREYESTLTSTKKIICTHAYSVDSRISYVYRIIE